MYGLAHAGLLWQKKLCAALQAEGSERSQADSCVFQRQRQGNVVVVIVVDVEDLLLLSATKENEQQALKDVLPSSPVKDLGEVFYYLGCHITRDPKARTVTKDQHQYSQTVTDPVVVRKTSAIPVSLRKAPLCKADGLQAVAEFLVMCTTPYREAVRVLIRIAMTRSDEPFAAHGLAKYGNNPAAANWKTQHVMRLTSPSSLPHLFRHTLTREMIIRSRYHFFFIGNLLVCSQRA